MALRNQDYLYEHLPGRIRNVDPTLFPPNPVYRLLQAPTDEMDRLDTVYNTFYERITPWTAPDEWVTAWLYALFGWSWFPSWFSLDRKRRLYAEFTRHLARRGTARGIEKFLAAFSVHATAYCQPQVVGESVWAEEPGWAINAPLGVVVQVRSIDDEVNFDVQGMVAGAVDGLVVGEGYVRNVAQTLTRREIDNLVRFEAPNAQIVVMEYLTLPDVGEEAWDSAYPVLNEGQIPDEQADTLGSAQGFTLIWSDEFNGPAGSAPDPTKWNVVFSSQVSNDELQYYVPTAAVQDGNGNLVITAAAASYTGPDDVTANYTSARLNTNGKFAAQYGRIEARIKLPIGQGIWPAFWMEGTALGSVVSGDSFSGGVGWPAAGEIDIMEAKGQQPGINHGSMHGPGYSGGQALTASYTLPSGESFGDDFHVFYIEWAPNSVSFYVDGNLYATQTPSSPGVPAGAPWPFNAPFFLILDLAVGGDYLGSPDGSTVFPQQMLIDYVRVIE